MRVEATLQLTYCWVMDNWLELRTAYRLARLGTVSATADDLGIHRATVNRHVDVIEAALGTRLFQRHARGYTLTDAGRDLLDVASRADALFSDLAGRAKGQAGQLSGSLVITSLSGLAPVIMPAIAMFRAAHPETDLIFSADAALARLEYGEAHVAIRAGPRPSEPDYVVLPFCKLRFGLFAARRYTDRFGVPDPRDLSAHQFVGAVDGLSRLPYARWMKKHVTQGQIALRTSDQGVINAAVHAGLGLGFIAEHDADHDADQDAEHDAGASPDLVEVIAPQDAWSTDLWIVTHVDLHRTLKAQEFLKCLKTLRV